MSPSGHHCEREFDDMSAVSQHECAERHKVESRECNDRHKSVQEKQDGLDQKIEEIKTAITGSVDGSIPGIRQELNKHSTQISSIINTLNDQNAQLKNISSSIERVQTGVTEVCKQQKQEIVNAATAAAAEAMARKSFHIDQKSSRVRLVIFGGAGAGLGTLIPMLIQAFIKWFQSHS